MNDTPSFNLKVILRETGLKADTLRAWERRYGLPSPARTEGKHRLYSERDIETVRWLIARQEEGLRIKNAVDLWRELAAAGQDPLTALHLDEPVLQSPQLPGIHADLDEIRQAWLAHAMDFDEVSAEIVLAQSFARYAPEIVCIEVLQKGLSEIGKSWYQGQITVQQEHFASALAIRHIDALLVAAPPPRRNKRILVGCPPQEEHVFSSLMIAFLLRQRGWEVVYLGANTPIQHLDATIQATHPDLVILTAMRLTTAAALLETAQAIQPGVDMAFGGPIFNTESALRDRIPGYFLGENYQEAIQKTEQILNARPKSWLSSSIEERYLRCLAHFLENKAAIESSVWRLAQKNGIPTRHLKAASIYFPESIIAALKLGYLEGLKSEIAWAVQFLENNQIPVEKLHQYLQIYLIGLKENLDERGQLLIDWLSAELEEIA